MVNRGSKLMTVPEVREALFELAQELEGLQHYAQANKLKSLSNQLKRRPVIRKTRVKSRPSTTAMRSMIRDYARENLGMSQAEIATHFYVNPGRVSEALRGKR